PAVLARVELLPRVTLLARVPLVARIVRVAWITLLTRIARVTLLVRVTMLVEVTLAGVRLRIRVALSLLSQLLGLWLVRISGSAPVLCYAFGVNPGRRIGLSRLLGFLPRIRLAGLSSWLPCCNLIRR